MQRVGNSSAALRNPALKDGAKLRKTRERASPDRFASPNIFSHPLSGRLLEKHPADAGCSDFLPDQAGNLTRALFR